MDVERKIGGAVMTFSMERRMTELWEERNFWRYVILLMRDMLLRFCCYFSF